VKNADILQNIVNLQ